MNCAAPLPRPTRFAELHGWAADDHAAALTVFLNAAERAGGPAWPALAARARETAPGAARAFFEQAFTPVALSDRAFLTGYYEPEIDAAPSPGGRFTHPLYAPPPDLTGAPDLTRAEIEAGALAGRGLELYWLADPAEAFFLHIQGSARLRLPDGRTVRVGFAARNGHPYHAIGKSLVARGEMTPETATADAIKDWIRARPAEGAALMNKNSSYIFFRRLDGLDEVAGPLGAMGAPVTAGRSLAIDPAHVPLGAPVWLTAPRWAPRGRLMIAQDVGAAIKGPDRADIFLGTGAAAGEAAGAFRETGALVALLPKA